jgi:hypothetical protein
MLVRVVSALVLLYRSRKSMSPRFDVSYALFLETLGLPVHGGRPFALGL